MIDFCSLLKLHQVKIESVLLFRNDLLVCMFLFIVLFKFFLRIKRSVAFFAFVSFFSG